ncbi:type II secretion system F family protein [Gemmata sp. JC717]|uniref:type II secretion system F family protein n=1 Tax=Gemmata algarum TaxID=2975278 RepID=UPI0021BA8ADF|nr:type II secretion system F family protein [Gemmata algarum]MDY3554906.1 type II secretion system F family protein [Gemmata algarum]
MLALAVGGLAFGAAALGALAVARLLEGAPTAERRRTSRRLRELGGAPEPESGGDAPRWWLAAVGARLGGHLVPRAGARRAELVARLALAGHRHSSAVLYFSALQLALVVAGASIAGGAAAAAGCTWQQTLMWATASGSAGLVAPSVLLSSRIEARRRHLRNALPDALDVMVLSVEGGAGLNAALVWAAEEIAPVHPLLGAELKTVQREVQLGLSVGEAVRGFADRCGLTEARELAAALLQSEKYGASVGKALRTFADAARQDRQAWAEEMAQKASVQIIFPMLLCIFPAIFIVLLGPAAMQMSRMFAR